MLDISRLRNPIQNYPWGSHTAIAEWLGLPRSPEPQAELWMGSHPKATSEALIDGRWIALSELVEHRRRELLGERETSLPFLFKVLAAAQPLSIQAHPDRRQARAGFEREESLGLARNADQRNYRDPNPKPELIYALTPFRMLRGFRPGAEIEHLFDGLELLDLLPGAEHLRGATAADLEAFLAAYLPRDEASRESLKPLLATVTERAAAHAEEAEEYACVGELARHHPLDPGILSPLFLHLIELQPGEAIYTGPGILHAYLEGLGIELMGNSDNVLRGGLTEKHVDVPGLLHILRFEPAEKERLAARVDVPGEERFSSPDGSFTLAAVTVDGALHRDAGRVEVMLCHQGEGVIENPSTGHQLAFSRGDSLLVPAAVGDCRISGRCRLFSATGSSSDSDRPASPSSNLGRSVLASGPLA